MCKMSVIIIQEASQSTAAPNKMRRCVAIGTEVWITIAISAVVAVAIAVMVYIMASKAGYEKRKREAEAAIGGAENEAKRIVEDSKKAAESKKREILLEAKEETHKLRLEFDQGS